MLKMYRNKVNLVKCVGKCVDGWFNGVPQPSEDLLFVKGFKYQISEDFIIRLEGITIDRDIIVEEFYEFYKDGTLILKRGFAWDGASGPTLDTKDTYIPSAVHDALYRMIRHGYLPLSFKPIADKIFYELLLQYGMFKLRAYIWYVMVSLFGYDACIKPKRVVRIAKKVKYFTKLA